MAMYSAQCLCTLVAAHSAIVTAVGVPLAAPSLLRFAVFALLLVHAAASRRWASSDGSDAFSQPAPEETASLASRLTLSWMASLLCEGNRSTLESYDLWELA